MADRQDHYKTLGVAKGASDAEIKRAYRKLARQWHPDVNASAQAVGQFKRVNEAYQTLSDPAKRRAYDALAEGAGFGGRAASGPGRRPNPGGSRRPAGAGFTGTPIIDDLFAEFFGAGGFDPFDSVGREAAPRRPAARARRKTRGSDLRYDLGVSFAEAVGGAVKTIGFTSLVRCPACRGSGSRKGSKAAPCGNCGGRGEVQSVRQTMFGQGYEVVECGRCHGEGTVVVDRCPSCGGEGRLARKRRLRVTIPAGVDTGNQVRLTGQGEAGPRGGPAGDLYVALTVAPHAKLRREGAELYCVLRLSITQAALGARVAIQTADGAEEVAVAPGTQPGAEIRLVGRGAPVLRSPGVRGDLHVAVEVAVPTRLTPRARAMLADLAAEFGETATG